MPELPNNESSRDDRVNDAIASYLEAVERGDSPDEREYLAQFPELASQLSLFFADRANLRDVAGGRSVETPPSEALSTDSTSSSLLARVKARDSDAWSKLSRLYAPMVYGWARRTGLQASDSADVVQEVFSAVAAHISEFRRQRPGDSFRGWLWTITRNKVRDHFRQRGAQPVAEGGSDAQARMLELPDGFVEDEPSVIAASAHSELTRRIVELVRAEFEPRTWQAFWRSVVDQQPPADVATELRMTVGAVYNAKSRVLGRLRQELAALMEG
jgi:RNA polymerase sigma-70 factor (ECF subfamily)